MSLFLNIIKNRKRLHVYQQLEHSDCGQTCIKIIAHYFGIRLNNADIRNITDANRIGMSAIDISDALKKIGLDSAVVKIGKEHLPKLPLPAIVYWNQNHFVVLHKIDRRQRYHIINPANGKTKIKEEDFISAFTGGGETGIVILADECMDSRQTALFKNSRATSYIHRPGLWSLMKSSWLTHKKTYSVILGLTLLSMIADIVIPFVFQRTIDEGISGKDIHLIWVLILSQFMIFFGSFIANWIVELNLSKLALSISIEMLNKYLEKLIKLPMNFFSRKVSADLIQKVEDHYRIQDFMINLPGTILFACINLAIFSTLLVYFKPLVFLIFLAGTILSMIWTFFFLRYRKEIDAARNGLMATNRNNLFELIGGIDEIKANNAHKSRVEIWNKVQTKYNSLAFKSFLINSFQNGGSSMFTRARDIAITGICATLVVQGDMTIGLMMTVSYIVGRLGIPFNSLILSFNSAQDASLSYERIEEVHSWEIEDGEISIQQTPSSIIFNDVSFKYPGAGNPMVLKNVTAEILKGETTAIVGLSGCGKSTMLKLLLGFYTPHQGDILFGADNLKDICSNSLSERIGIVMQGGTIFSDSIKANIALADEEPDEAAIHDALKIADLAEFVGRLPMGIHTRIGESGLDLSGGERQRILIARAIYRNPDILMLDEATSSLDARTEKNVMTRIFEKYSDKTLIIVAHRLCTIRDANRILVMENGEIVENGTHKSLLKRNGTYATLIRNQMKTEANGII